MNAKKLRVVAVLVGLCAISLTSLSSRISRFAVAADPIRSRVEFDRVYVPADQPAAWPKEVNRLVPVPRQEFESLVEQLSARSLGPRSAWLKSAHYEATLVNDTLRGGLMTASVQRLGGRPTLLELGPFSLAMNDLKWQDRTAIWGSSEDGRTWVFADGNNDELLGEWTCSGRAFPGGIDFDLQLPRATISFLDLRIPRGFSVNAPSAEVKRLTDAPNEETHLWRIHCGTENRCRVTLVAQEGLEPSRRGLLVEHDMQVVVREEDLRFQLNLSLEALDAPIQDLMLRVPADLEIYSAIYGIDTPVPIQRTSEAKAEGRLSIHLPGPLSGRRRSLRVDGIAVQKPGQPTTLPQVVVENSTFDGGHLAVSVQSPLQVRSIRANGFRQRTTDVDSLTFQQLTADAQLILDVHRAQVSLSGQVLSILDVQEDSWNLASEIIWNSQSGGAYQTSCLLPPDWEVTDVRLVSDTESTRVPVQSEDAERLRESPKLNWEIQSQSGGRSLLAIEFLESIQPGRPRAVKVFARRQPPPLGQLESIPLPQLVNCDVSEVILGIQIPNSMTPTVSADSRLERIARPTTSVFVIPPERSNFERRWYRGDSWDGTGSLQLKPRLQPVYVRTATVIEALPAEFRLKYSIQYEHRQAEADRLLIYLTEASPDVRWTWKGTQAIDLSALRLSKSQHIEWNLPSKGELWEIRLPRAMGRGVTIEGTTNSRWSTTNRPALLFIPQAVEKLAEVRLMHPEALDLTFETDGLKPTTGQRLSWWYATPQIEFDLALRNPEPSQEFPLMVSMQLRTLMSADTDGYDLYRARLQLENGSAQESLRIKLDPSAIVQEAFVGGESIAATLQGGEFVIPGLNAARRDSVELIYRVRAHANALYERRRIIVPQVTGRVLDFSWEFGIPPSARMFAEPHGVRLSRSLPSPTWNTRLLGPLGRSRSDAIFNPLRLEAWVQLFEPRQPVTPSIGESDGELVAPIEWQVHQGIVPEAPTELWVELWHSTRIQLLTWISLGVCLSTGIILRMLGWKRRDLLAAYWLGLTVAATFSVSAPYTGFLGAAIAGTLIALLIPRQLLQKAISREDVTVERRRSSSGIVITCVLGGLTFYAVSPFFDVQATAQDSPTDENVPNKRPKVFIPVDANGHPSETLPIVYVSRDALARWKAIASDLASEPSYLISSARYEVAVTAEGNLNLYTKYQVHLLRSTDPVVTVALPLSEVSLPDQESCRVNGLPHSISALANSKGYSVELTRTPQAASDVSPSNPLRVQSEFDIETFEIELRSRKTLAQPAVMELHIPPVASSNFVLTFQSATPFVELVGGRGSRARDAENRSLSSDLGTTSNIQVRWGQVAPPRKPTQLSASLLQHLELRPAYAEMYFHFVGAIETGSLDSLEFKLPQNAIVRKNQLRVDDLLRSDVVVTKDGERRLRLVFEKSRQTTITVDGTLVLPQSDSMTQTPLPIFGLASSDWLEFQYEHNWWGVSTSPDFRIDSTNLDSVNVNSISSDAYLNAWLDATDPRHPDSTISYLPQATFELPAESTPTFTLIPNQPRRHAVQWKQTGFIGKRRLEWTLVGEIETTQSPTFQTVLLVDRRLRIEKVSVMENDAERSTRWTESRAEPSRVVLFLSDKTQGKQTITLKGSLPLIPGTPIALPSIRAEDCEIADSRLVLTRDPEVDVTFTPPREWKVLAGEEPNAATSRSDESVILGSYQLTDATTRGTIQTSSRHSRCSSRAAALLRRADGSGWQLKYRLEMTPEGESPLRIGLTFPASFTDMNSVTVERAEPAWHEVHDGIRQLDLLLNRGEGPGTVVIQFETTLAEPKLPDWDLPFPIPLPSTGHETLLVIEPESIWFPTGGTEVRVADLPEWSSTFYSELPGGGVAFKIGKPLVQLQRDIVTAETRNPLVRLLDQRIWSRKDGSRSGITQAFLSGVRNDLEFEVPSYLRVTSVFLDDQPVALTAPADGRLKIPMADAGTESLLTLTWIVDQNDVKLQPSVKESFLWPREIEVERNLITILPEENTILWCRSGLTEVTSLDQGLDRLETLLDRHAALGDETRGALTNRWLIDQLQARLATRLPLEVRHPSEEVARRLERWKQIIRGINRLEPVPPAPSIGWQARLLEGPVTDSTDAIRGKAINADSIRLWQFNRHFIRLGLSILLALILIPIFRRTIRIEWSRWLSQHVAISWLLLATVWWLFLTPSALGPILLLVGLLRTVTQYRPARSAA